MKKLQITGILALAGAALFANSAKAQQTVGFSNGDLLLGFETSSGTGTDYELDIGSITKFSTTTSFTLNSTNTTGYGTPVTDLQNDFGSGTSWDSSSTLWGVIGAIDNTGAALGLPKNTVFATSPTATAWPEHTNSTQSGYPIGTITGEGTQNAGDYAGSTSTSNSNIGVNQTISSDSLSWAAANPYGANTTYNSNDTTSFEAYSTIEGATTGNLELFQMEPTNSSPSGSHLTTQDLGSFSIDNSGDITWTGSSAPVPEPSTWASLFLAAGAILMLARRRGGPVKA